MCLGEDILSVTSSIPVTKNKSRYENWFIREKIDESYWKLWRTKDLKTGIYSKE